MVVETIAYLLVLGIPAALISRYYFFKKPRTPDKLASDHAAMKRGLEDLISRWKSQESEFRQYITHRSDALKLIGTGNATGLLSVGAFLTTGSRGWMAVLVSKACLLMFGFGFLLFTFGYENLYHFATDTENALSSVRKDDNLNDEAAQKMIKRAIERSDRAAKVVSTSILCFGFGCGMAFVAIMFGIT